MSAERATMGHMNVNTWDNIFQRQRITPPKIVWHTDGATLIIFGMVDHGVNGNRVGLVKLLHNQEVKLHNLRVLCGTTLLSRNIITPSEDEVFQFLF